MRHTISETMPVHPSQTATPALTAELTAERDRIDRMITELVNSRDVLNQVIDTASGRCV